MDSLQEIADPKHTAFMVIDIQNDNASPKGVLASQGKDISWVRAIVPNVKTVLHEARKLRLPVIFTRVTRSKDGSLESDPILRRRARSHHSGDAAGYHLEGTWDHEVLEEFEPRPEETQIIKYRPSAFLGTPLEMLLKNRGVKSVVVAGLVTEACVESTVIDLEQYGYYAVILSDCIASSRPDLHEAALRLMSAKWDVVTSPQLLQIWRSARIA